MPLHPHLFKTLRDLKNFKSVSNPYEARIDALDILGHSGQPVDDILRCTQMESPLDALQTTLDGQHLAPTAPDTLAMQPFTQEDPFVIQDVPHVLFSGGHERASHEWHAAGKSDLGTTCICVPDFRVQP